MQCLCAFIAVQIFFLEILSNHVLVHQSLHTISKRSASTSNDVKIVNGTEATPNEYPSIVTLRVNGTSFCGGTIVGQRWIVTASHCLVSKRWCLPNQTIAAGKHNLQVTEVSEQTVEVVGTILHPGFVRTNYVNDIALLKLKSPLKFNDKVKPVELPPKDYNELGIATVVGWGTNKLGDPMSNVLMKLDVPVITNEKCKEIWPDVARPTIVCAGPLDGDGGNPCYGDSGGPLYKTSNGKHILLGLVAHGDDSCTPSVAYYTRISEFIDWLQEIMSNTAKQARISITSFVAETLCDQLDKYNATHELPDPIKVPNPHSSVNFSWCDWNRQCSVKSCLPFRIRWC